MRKQMLGSIIAIAMMLPFLATIIMPANGNSTRIMNYQSRLYVNPSGFDSNQSNGAWSMFRGSLNHTGAVNTILASSPTWTCMISNVRSSPAIASGRVYVGSEDNRFYCLNATTGASLWSRGTGGMIISSPAIASGRVYVGSEDNNLYCLNATTGAFLWSRGTGGMIISSPAIASGRVYVGSEDNNLYCLNATTSAVLWTFGTSDIVASSPAIDDGKVFFGSNDHTFHCINATTGATLWSYSSDHEFFSSPTIANGRVFEGNLDHNLYCFNETNGNIIWTFKTNFWVFASPSYYQNKIFIGSEDDVIYCVNATNGFSIWNYTTNGMVYSSPAISSGFLYEGSDDGNLYCLNSSSGALIWSYPMHNEVYSSPAISSGHVYVGSYDKLYCLPMELISTAPRALSAIGEKNKIQLAWQVPINPWNASFKYRVYRSTASGLEIPFMILSNTSWINNGLINGQVYYYEISAIDGMNVEGQISTEISSIPGIPSIPLNLQAIGGNKVTNLSWQAPMHNGGYAITGYQIYQGVTTGSILMIDTIQNITNFSITGLANGQSYYFGIAAMNLIGTGPISILATTITTLNIPSIPLSVTAKASDSQVILNWTKPSSNGGSPITGYNIYRGLSMSDEILYKSIGNLTSFVDTSLTNGQNYYYKISAVNSVGESMLSSEVIGIPSSSTSTPGYQPFVILFSLFIVAAIYIVKKRK